MDALRWACIALVVLAPFPLGSNHPETWSLLSLIVGILTVAGLVILVGINREDLSPQRRLLVPAILFFAIISFIYVQTLDLDPGLGNPAWQEIEALTGQAVRNSISVNPHDTQTALMRLISYACVFWLAFTLGVRGHDAWLQVRAFAYASLAYATYGIVVYFAGNETILWFDKWAYPDDLSSTFVNRNTYATFAGTGVLVAAACLLREFSRLQINQIRDLLETPPRRLRRIYTLVLTVLLCGTALFLTHSRGGFLATVGGGLIFLMGAAYILKGRNLPLIAGTLIVICVMTFTLMISGDITLDRLFATQLGRALRDEVYVLVWQGIDVSPLVGWGYGTFEEAFRLFYTFEIGQFNWDKAHNTYLETLFELGWPASLVFCSIFLFCAGLLVRGILIRKRHQLLPLLGLSVLVLSALHAVVDFSHQIPAMAVGFAWILGSTLTQSLPSHRRRSSS